MGEVELGFHGFLFVLDYSDWNLDLVWNFEGGKMVVLFTTPYRSGIPMKVCNWRSVGF